MMVDESVILKQITDDSAEVPLEDIAEWDWDRQRSYYEKLERRVIATNVLLDYVGIAHWAFGEASSAIECAYERTIQRWHDLTGLIPFEMAHDYASTAHERRQAIRNKAKEKLTGATQGAVVGEQGQARSANDSADSRARVSAA